MADRTSVFESFLHKKMTRRAFIGSCVSWLAAFSVLRPLAPSRFAHAAEFNGRPKKNTQGKFDLVEAEGKDPYAMTRKAVEAMGGMERFVRRNSTVVIKPNMAWDRTPEQAANTNPEVVAALVALCFEAGAKRVNVFDATCNDARRCYANSQIQKAAEAKGAKVYFINDWDVVNARFAHKSPMQEWPILRDAIECDTFINVPIVKHHGLTRLTLSMKNLMGVCTGVRGLLHIDIGRKLVDLTSFINPDLTVIDAYRVLLRNGPTGGSLNDVEYRYKVLVATDPTLADIYACGLVNVDPREVPYLKYAIESRVGITDLSRASVHSIKV